MQLDKKYGQILFGAAVLDLAVILVGLQAHVPVSSALCTVVALIEILFLSLMSGDAGGVPLLRNNIAALTFAQPDERLEVSKRIQRFGIDGEHPHLTRSGWMLAIAGDLTQASYWEWVTKNEILAERLLSRPEMNVRRGDGTTDQKAGGVAGLKLVPSRK